MNENGASAALSAAAAGDEGKMPELTQWLSAQEGIAGRYLAGDLRIIAAVHATEKDDGGLSVLLTDLRGRPDSVLAAFFREPTASARIFELAGAMLGPAGQLREHAPSEQALEAWDEDSSALAVLARHPAQGRLGAIRTAAWLQTVLGAISLAAYAHFGTIAPLAACPALGTAVYLSTPSGKPEAVDRAALAAPGLPPTEQLDELLSDERSRKLIDDATALNPTDLTQQRLTLAARWLQLAASAISAADAIVSLGIALETIAGDQKKAAVVERITKRSAIFIANGAPMEERSDVYYEQLARAKKLYDLRSRAAHGQYDDWTEDISKSEAGRREFHQFVLDVALGFREHARARGMRNASDFTNWWERAELEGFFT